MKNILRQNINTLICCIVTLILAAFTIYAVLKGSGISLNELIADLRDASLWGLIPASIGTLGFIWFEGEALRVIVRHMGYPTNRTQGFVYAAADVYFSAITPSASGGQPASAFFMMQDKIPGTAVMTALLLNLIMYTLAIITIGIADILLFPGIFLKYRQCRLQSLLPHPDHCRRIDPYGTWYFILSAVKASVTDTGCRTWYYRTAAQASLPPARRPDRTQARILHYQIRPMCGCCI